MAKIDRRELFCGAAAGAVITVLPSAASVQAAASTLTAQERPWRVIDTNVSLFQWPFRRLPLDTVERLVEKLRAFNVTQAWAGSFEGLLHRDVAGVNARLNKSCRAVPDERLVPIGTVNLTLPDWEEDVRRCHEEHHMPGVRLHPNYHGYALDDPRFARLLALAVERKMFVQLAVSMEDVRTQHPLVRVADVDLASLPDLVAAASGVKVQLLNYRPRGAAFEKLAKAPNVFFDVARVEATDGVAKLMRSPAGSRVMFGTHAPLLVYESALIRAYEAGLTEEETRALFEQNAQHLLPVTREK